MSWDVQVVRRGTSTAQHYPSGSVVDAKPFDLSCHPMGGVQVSSVRGCDSGHVEG